MFHGTLTFFHERSSGHGSNIKFLIHGTGAPMVSILVYRVHDMTSWLVDIGLHMVLY